MVTDEAKTSADQIGEISKLVQDAQDKLDQVVRALRSLEDRLTQQAVRGDDDRH
jgi:methyl-accepting chemotaxis protein